MKKYLVLFISIIAVLVISGCERRVSEIQSLELEGWTPLFVYTVDTQNISLAGVKVIANYTVEQIEYALNADEVSVQGSGAIVVDNQVFLRTNEVGSFELRISVGGLTLSVEYVVLTEALYDALQAMNNLVPALSGWDEASRASHYSAFTQANLQALGVNPAIISIYGEITGAYSETGQQGRLLATHNFVWYHSYLELTLREDENPQGFLFDDFLVDVIEIGIVDEYHKQELIQSVNSAGRTPATVETALRSWLPKVSADRQALIGLWNTRYPSEDWSDLETSKFTLGALAFAELVLAEDDLTIASISESLYAATLLPGWRTGSGTDIVEFIYDYLFPES